MNEEMISATLWYYDDDHNYETGEKIFKALEKHSFFQPTLFYAEKITKNRQEKYNSESKEKYYKAFTDKSILGVTFTNCNSHKQSTYWGVDFTFAPNKEILGFEPVVRPRNLISIEATLDMFKNEAFMDEFMDTVKELICIVDPFYGMIDTTSNANRLLDEVNEECYKPHEYIQTIFGGNYFGKKYCDLYGREKVMDVPLQSKEAINNGILFMLSNNCLDFAGNSLDIKRNQIMDYFKVGKKKFQFFRKKN